MSHLWKLIWSQWWAAMYKYKKSHGWVGWLLARITERYIYGPYLTLYFIPHLVLTFQSHFPLVSHFSHNIKFSLLSYYIFTNILNPLYKTEMNTALQWDEAFYFPESCGGCSVQEKAKCPRSSVCPSNKRRKQGDMESVDTFWAAAVTVNFEAWWPIGKGRYIYLYKVWLWAKT